MISLQGILSCYTSLNSLRDYFGTDLNDNKHLLLKDRVESWIDKGKETEVLFFNEQYVFYSNLLHYLKVKKDDIFLVSPYVSKNVLKILKDFQLKISVLDINPKTGLVEKEHVEKTIRFFNVNYHKIKGIIIKDIAGVSNIDSSWKSLWEEKEHLIIHDASESIGARADDKYVGSLAPITIFNLHGKSLLNVLDASMIVINEDFLPYRFFRKKGKIRYNKWLKDTKIGKLDNIRTIIGIEQLNHFPQMLLKQQLIGNYYRVALNNLKHITIRDIPNNSLPSFSNFIIFVDNKKKFISYMYNKKIHVNNIYEVGFFQQNKNLTGVEQFEKNKICIPVGWWLTDENKTYISEMIKNYDKIF